MTRTIRGAAVVLLFCISTLACAPKMGSEAWCKQMKEAPKADWSTNDAKNYAKHCVFK